MFSYIYKYATERGVLLFLLATSVFSALVGTVVGYSNSLIFFLYFFVLYLSFVLLSAWIESKRVLTPIRIETKNEES